MTEDPGMETTPSGISRRQILQAGGLAGVGLVLGFHWRPARALAANATGEPFVPNAFVRIAGDHTVTVILKHVEAGQGVSTGLPTLVAEELDAAWSQMRFEHAPVNFDQYKNLIYGVQLTGGSTAISNSWEQLRQAGATARAMLINAAAQEWQVNAKEITVTEGWIEHAASGRRGQFGDFVERAAGITVPEDVPLKKPEDFRLIGQRLPRLDVPEKTDGAAQFTQDFRLPGMLTALVAHPPRFGATVASFDATAARKVSGVEHVVQVPTGVAVVARDFWAAKKGRDALQVSWDESQAEKRSSEEIEASFHKLLDQPGIEAIQRGDAAAALAEAEHKKEEKVIEADYFFPYLAHAPMETLGFIVQLDGDRARAWGGSQFQTIDQAVIAGVLEIPAENVEVTTLLAGGTFGRRATPSGDIASEAAQVARAVGGKALIKLLWTREDDLRGGSYRPLFVHRLRAGLDAEGRVIAWHHRLVGQSIAAGTALAEAMVQNGVDSFSVEGAKQLPYDIPNFSVELQSPETGVPVLWWRSVGHSHNGYSTETFLDQLAKAAGKDPVALRRELLHEHPRHLGVLELAAEKADWGKALPAGRARGIAVHESFKSFVAQVVEITLDDEGMPRVERVVCAVDCGIAINPDVIVAQMESGIGYGLNAALFNEVEIDAGRVRCSNFHDYRPLRIHEMPPVEVHIVPSDKSPTGVGEPGVPPLAPAVANAYFALTGKSIHRLPFVREINAERAS